VRFTADMIGRRCAQETRQDADGADAGHNPRRYAARRKWMADAAPKGARQDAVGAGAGHVHQSPPELTAGPRSIRNARPASRLGGFSSSTSGADAGQYEVGHAKLLSLPTIPKRAAARALFVPAAAHLACPHLRRPQER